MLSVEQDAQHQRGKSIWYDQSSRFRLQKAIIAAVAKEQEQFNDRQLHKNDAKNQKDSRVLLKAFWLIDPKLRDGSSQDQERDNVILRWLRLLTTKDQKRQTTSEERKNAHL